MTASKIVHLEHVALDPEIVAALDAFAVLHGISRRDIVPHILRDWLTAMNALPYHELDEDTEPAGEA
jgi:hypothetical protein